MMSNAQRAVVRELYRLARSDRPADLGLLARRLGLSCVETDRVLGWLEGAGLVDAERVRLTLAGLAIALVLGDAPCRERQAA
jgi:Mn-dependent DtxR family transcriptional regulator